MSDLPACDVQRVAVIAKSDEPCVNHISDARPRGRLEDEGCGCSEESLERKRISSSLSDAYEFASHSHEAAAIAFT